MKFDLEAVRAQFPALQLEDNGQRRVYFDNPAGTQVPVQVLDAMRDCMISANANLGGPWPSSVAAGRIVDEAHQAMVDLLGAGSDKEIIFGANMTTLTFQLSRAIGRDLKPGDEIIVTEMDHDANVTPWVLLARDLGLVVHKIRLDTERFRLDLKHFDELLNDHTALVCVGHASNLLGTLNDIETIVERAHQHKALVFVDAVHSVPHLSIDVQNLQCDFLACSPYKFFGPHQGVIWGRQELLERIDAYKLRPATDQLPGRFETGTQSHECMAGVTASVDYLASIAGESADPRKQKLVRSLDLIRDYEMDLCSQMLDQLRSIKGLKIYGIVDEPDERAPTISFRISGWSVQDLATELGRRNIFSWSGHSYAVEPCNALGILHDGGVLRVGMVHYNNTDDIAVLIEALKGITR